MSWRIWSNRNVLTCSAVIAGLMSAVTPWNAKFTE
jgi:hypothetical protein